MQKEAGIQKTNENPSEPKPDGLKPKAIKCKKTLEFKKQKKIHRSLNPTALNQRQKNVKRRWNSKNKQKLIGA